MGLRNCLFVLFGGIECSLQLITVDFKIGCWLVGYGYLLVLRVLLYTIVLYYVLLGFYLVISVVSRLLLLFGGWFVLVLMLVMLAVDYCYDCYCGCLLV